MAAMNNDIDCLKYILDNTEDPLILFTLAAMTENCDFDCFMYLEKYMTNDFANLYVTLLVNAVKRGNIKILKRLHGTGHLSDPHSIIYLAAKHGQLECIKYLYKLGHPRVNPELAIAVKNKDLETIKLIYDNSSKYIIHALEMAEKNNHKECAKYLRKRK
jgi:hypothetical protein